MPRTINQSLPGAAVAAQTVAVKLLKTLSKSFNFGGMPRMELELECLRGVPAQDKLKQANAVIAWLAAR